MFGHLFHSENLFVDHELALLSWDGLEISQLSIFTQLFDAVRVPLVLLVVLQMLEAQCHQIHYILSGPMALFFADWERPQNGK